MEDMVNTTLSYFRGKKVLVTGHTGFKGTWLVRTLLFAGAEVIGSFIRSPNESFFVLH